MTAPFDFAAMTPGKWEVSSESIVARSPQENRQYGVCVAVIEDDGGYEGSPAEQKANAKGICILRNAQLIRERRRWFTMPRDTSDNTPCGIGEWMAMRIDHDGVAVPVRHPDTGKTFIAGDSETPLIEADAYWAAIEAREGGKG